MIILTEDQVAIKYIGKGPYKFDRIGRPYLNCEETGDIFIVTKHFGHRATTRYKDNFETIDISNYSPKRGRASGNKNREPVN